MAVLALGLLFTAAGSAAGTAAGGTLLGLTAASIGATVGGVVGSSIGSYVDSTFIFPAIFGRGSSTLYGPKISDIQLTTSSPGSPMNKCFGRQIRLPGTVIWMSPLDQHTTQNDVSGGGGGMFGKGGSSQTVDTFTYTISVGVAICEGPINGIRKIWADGQLIYDSGVVDKRLTSITFYQGTADQLPDPLIQATEGSSLVPAFINTAYVVIQDFNIGDWGQRVPNFTFLVEEREQCLLADVIEEIWERAGRPLSEVDVTYVRDVEVIGYNLSGPQSAIKVLEPLLMAYDVISQEVNGIVHFRHRRDSLPVVIPANSLAAYEEGTTDPIRALKITDSPGFDLPGQVVVSYLDPGYSWQKQSQSANTFASPAPTTQTLDVPLVMFANDAKALAQRILWGAWAERDMVEFTMTPSQLHVLESDLLTITADGQTLNMRVTNIKMGNNFVYEVEATTEQEQVLTQTAIADVPIIPADPSPLAARVHNLVIMEIPVLPFNDKGLYFTWAVCRGQAGDPWKNGQKLEATEPGLGWQDDLLTPDGYVDQFDYGARGEGYMGICQSVLPPTGPVGYFDLVTTVVITMFNGQLTPVLDGSTYLGKWNAVTNHPTITSGVGTRGDYYRVLVGFGSNTQNIDGTTIWVGNDIIYFNGSQWVNLGNITPESSEDVFTGKNLLYVGKADGTGEVIQFYNASLVAPATYQISKLLRGRMGTEDRMASHGGGEYAVLLDASNQVHTIGYVKAFGATHYHKALPAGAKLRSATEVPATRLCRSISPFSPVQIKGARNLGTGDIYISWIRRTDGWETMFGGPDAQPSDYPTVYPIEAYDVEIYQVAGTNPIRTLRAGATGTGPVANLPSISYTNAMQIADDLGFNGYPSEVESQAFAYWPMDTLTGSSVIANPLATGDITLTGSYTVGQPGLLFGSTSTAIQFSGGSASGSIDWPNPSAYTFECLVEPFWASGTLGYNPCLAMLKSITGTMVWEIHIDQSYGHIGIHNQYGDFSTVVTGIAQNVPFLLTVEFGTNANYEATVMTDNPYVYLRLDEAIGTNANDSSGHGLSFTYANCILGTAGALTGDADTAVTTNGTTSYVSRNTLDLSATSTVSVEFWVWLNANAISGQSQMLFEVSDGTGPNGSCGVFEASDGVSLELYCTGATGATAVTYPRFSAAAWHHIVAVFDMNGGAAGIKLYVDSVLQTQNATLTAATNSNNFSASLPVFLMARDGTSQFTAGILDDTAIYTGELAGVAVSDHYNAGKFGPVAGGHIIVSVNGAVQGSFDLSSFDTITDFAQFDLAVGTNIGGDPYIGLVDEVSLYATALGPAVIFDHNVLATTLIIGELEVIVYQINPNLKPFNKGRGTPSVRTRIY